MKIANMKWKILSVVVNVIGIVAIVAWIALGVIVLRGGNQ